MSMMINGTLDLADPDAARALVREAIAEDKISNAEAARRAGMAESTFAAWLAGKYSGNNEKTTGDALRWLASRRSQKVAAATISNSPAFIDTETAVGFMGAMQYAQVAGDFTIIVGAPGVGKTQAAEAYQARNPNVYLVTMEPSISSPAAMLGEICAELGIPEKSSTKQARAIRRFFKGVGGLLIVDEAQHLTTKALDGLRSLNDRRGVAVVAIGNPSIMARLAGTGSDEFAQLHSRVGVGLVCQKPKDSDISTLIAAWGVTDAEEVAFLTLVARKSGALRALDKTMRLASTLAAGSGDARGLRHLKAARSKLGRAGAEG